MEFLLILSYAHPHWCATGIQTLYCIISVINDRRKSAMNAVLRMAQLYFMGVSNKVFIMTMLIDYNCPILQWI
jgi:hypothetical protein